MGNLTKNFSSWEFACSCGCGEAIVDDRLIAGLQEFRDRIGMAVHVTSGFRCPKNRWYSPTSQHSYGRAADIVCAVSMREMLDLANQIDGFSDGGIGAYPCWPGRHTHFVHVDTRGYLARWGRVEGKYTTYRRAIAYAGSQAAHRRLS